MNELDLAFNDFINNFKELSNIEKRSEVIESIKDSNAIIMALAEKENIDLTFLRSNNSSASKNILENEDDFLEALIVYIENSKNLLSQYLINKI